MTRYHFTTANGGLCKDPEGTELASDAEAKIMAVQFAGEVLASEPKMLWRDGQFKVEVSDDKGAIRWTVMAIATEVAS